MQLTLQPATYAFNVVATDNTGRVDPTPATVTFTILAGGPDVTLAATPPVLSRGAAASFSFSSQTAGATFQCRSWLHGAPAPGFSSCSSPRQYSGLGNGTRRFEVRAVDPSGRVSASPAAWQYTLDTVGPTFRLPQTPPASTRSTSARFVINPEEILQGTATCKLDTRPATACSGADFVDYSGLTDAQHRFAVTGTDLAGNRRTTTYQWTVSQTAPTTASTNVPAD
jgi:hypothetical protein